MIAEIPPAGPLTAAAKIFGYLIIDETKFFKTRAVISAASLGDPTSDL